ncbi:MAG: hypothetical protein SGPRY_000305 [Prymnesium sp.]
MCHDINEDTLQLVEPCRFIAKLNIDPTDSPSTISTSTATSGTAEYLCECLDAIQINLDAFHLRVCNESVASLTSVLDPLLSRLENPEEIESSKSSRRSLAPLSGRASSSGNHEESLREGQQPAQRVGLALREISIFLVSSLSHSPTPFARVSIADLSAAAYASEKETQARQFSVEESSSAYLESSVQMSFSLIDPGASRCLQVDKGCLNCSL